MLVQTPEVMRAAHTLLSEKKYDLKPVERGYANRTLLVDLDTNEIQIKPVSRSMKDTFTGGRGFCLWLLWNAVKDTTKWNDPENELVIAGGPIGGITAYPGSGKCTVVTISPTTHSVIDSNSGGYFGPYLKFSGFDVIEVKGKAKKDVIIFVDGDNGRVTIEEAPLEDLNTHLLNKEITEMYTDPGGSKRGISVVTAGAAADHCAICGLNISYNDPRREEVRIKQAAGVAPDVCCGIKRSNDCGTLQRMNANSNNVANMEYDSPGRRVSTKRSLI